MTASLPLSLLESLLAEDVPDGDLTTEALGIGAQTGRMEFRARGSMIVAGIDIAASLIAHAGGRASVLVPDGTRAREGELLLAARGHAASLHASWKTAQTLTEIVSGIASATRALVDAVEAVDPAVRVACTRKTVPGARRLYVHAVRVGGAVPHRLGLSETVLVFPEHRAFLGGAKMDAIAARLRGATPEKKIAIEVKTVEDAREAIEAGFDIVQLEKMKPNEVAAVANIAQGRTRPILVAAAGGISAANAAEYVKAGAGLIVSSWPYTARPADVAVAIAAQ